MEIRLAVNYFLFIFKFGRVPTKLTKKRSQDFSQPLLKITNVLRWQAIHRAAQVLLCQLAWSIADTHARRYRRIRRRGTGAKSRSRNVWQIYCPFPFRDSGTFSAHSTSNRPSARSPSKLHGGCFCFWFYRRGSYSWAKDAGKFSNSQ